MRDDSGKRGPVDRTLRLDDATPFQLEVAATVRAHYRPCLVRMSGARVGEKTVIEGGSVVIGRSPGAGLRIEDQGASWEHARIEDRGGSWAVVDMGSTNGTAVNGRKIDEQLLSHGDKITLGTTLLRFDVQDAADQALDQLVERLISVDDLSGLYLRRRFDAELDQMIAAAQASNGAVGLLVMDLDGIKAINDAHGHLFGAFTIGEAGKLIGRIVEGRGIACRWGGDEFLGALPTLNLEGTVHLGEEIVAAIGAHRFERDTIPLKPGISIGAASFPQSAPTAEALFHAADEAMYRAKRAGKNRVST